MKMETTMAAPTSDTPRLEDGMDAMGMVQCRHRTSAAPSEFDDISLESQPPGEGEGEGEDGTGGEAKGTEAHEESMSGHKVVAGKKGKKKRRVCTCRFWRDVARSVPFVGPMLVLVMLWMAAVWAGFSSAFWARAGPTLGPLLSRVCPRRWTPSMWRKKPSGPSAKGGTGVWTSWMRIRMHFHDHIYTKWNAVDRTTRARWRILIVLSACMMGVAVLVLVFKVVSELSVLLFLSSGTGMTSRTVNALGLDLADHVADHIKPRVVHEDVAQSVADTLNRVVVEKDTYVDACGRVNIGVLRDVVATALVPLQLQRDMFSHVAPWYGVEPVQVESNNGTVPTFLRDVVAVGESCLDRSVRANVTAANLLQAANVLMGTLDHYECVSAPQVGINASFMAVRIHSYSWPDTPDAAVRQAQKVFDNSRDVDPIFVALNVVIRSLPSVKTKAYTIDDVSCMARIDEDGEPVVPVSQFAPSVHMEFTDLSTQTRLTLVTRGQEAAMLQHCGSFLGSVNPC